MLTTELDASLNAAAKATKTTIIGPGSRLKKIRESRHISVEEMAKRLCLSVERLLQIERDDYQKMGACTFAKGYLRSYASQLDLPAEEIDTFGKDFDSLGLSANIERNKPELIHEKIEQQTSAKNSRWIGSFVLLLLLAAAGYLWHNHFYNIHKLLNTSKTNNNIETASTTYTPTPLPFAATQEPTANTNNKPLPNVINETSTTVPSMDLSRGTTNTDNASPSSSESSKTEKLNLKKIKTLPEDE